MYCDYAAYTAMGGTMSEKQFTAWEPRAARKIDALTCGRARAFSTILEAELADACGQIADVLLRQNAARENNTAGLSGVNTDGYSESYVDPSVVERAANAACVGILRDALGDDVHGLLYAGVC